LCHRVFLDARQFVERIAAALSLFAPVRG
jgi:hypothetical protein